MRTGRILLVDIVVTAVYLLAANPALTGLLVHEWVSLGAFIALAVHSAQHYDWVLDVLRNALRSPTVATVGNLVLDVVSAIVFMVAMVSGVMVSRHILPLLGFVAPDYFFWNPLHSISAKLLFALLLVHLVVHFKWFWGLIRSRKP